MKCNNCNSNETYVKIYEHNYMIKGREVKFSSLRRFCKECNQFVFDERLDNEASLKAIEIFNQKYGVLGKEIIALRKKYQLSQELFAKVIGCAKKTLISYEQEKSIPNDTYLMTIRTLIKNPEYIELIMDANKDMYSKEDYNKIIEKIDASDIHAESPSVFNGFTKKNTGKLKNIILMLADKSIQKTKLLKELFYIDFLCYKNTGSSMTGLSYVKINYGPVPDQFENMIQSFVEENVIDYRISYQNKYEQHNIKSKMEANQKFFDDEELQLIKKVREYFKDFGSKEIADYSHQEKAFKETKYKESIDYNYAFDIELK